MDPVVKREPPVPDALSLRQGWAGRRCISICQMEMPASVQGSLGLPLGEPAHTRDSGGMMGGARRAQLCVLSRCQSPLLLEHQGSGPLECEGAREREDATEGSRHPGNQDPCPEAPLPPAPSLPHHSFVHPGTSGQLHPALRELAAGPRDVVRDVVTAGGDCGAWGMDRERCGQFCLLQGCLHRQDQEKVLEPQSASRSLNPLFGSCVSSLLR